MKQDALDMTEIREQLCEQCNGQRVKELEKDLELVFDTLADLVKASTLAIINLNYSDDPFAGAYQETLRKEVRKAKKLLEGKE